MGFIAYCNIDYYIDVLGCRLQGYMLQVLGIPLWGSLRIIVSNIILDFTVSLSFI